MATNLDHSAASNQLDPVTETPQTSILPTATSSDEAPVMPDGAVRPSMSEQVESSLPKTVLRRPLPLTNEREGSQSLDDTVMRPMPARPTVWSEELRRPRQEERPKAFRISAAVLVCIVAAVSFVAGGVVARLSSQVPVLFAEKAESAHSQASYAQETAETAPEPQDEPTQELETTTQNEQDYNEPISDMDSDTVSDIPEQQTTGEDNSWQWNLDEEGDSSITYDPYTNQMTIDYEGYSFSMPIGDLIDSDQNGYRTYSPNDTGDSYTQNRTYDDNTRYNSEDTRDQYEWGTPRSFGWS